MKNFKWKGRGLPPYINKWFKVMKLTIFFMFLGLMQLSASVYSQNTRLTLDVKHARVIDVLEEIEEQTEFRFAYSSQYIDLNRRVTVAVDKKSIQETLHQVFDEAGVTFTVTDRQILLYPGKMVSESVSGQQPVVVSGKVTDSRGGALPGVTVVIRGTTTGTITDFDGNYSLSNVPDNGVLVFSFVGMKPQEIPVAGKTTFNVTLEELIFGVDEVVVTALGIKREEKALGYAVQAVSGEGLQTVKGVDMGTSLTARSPG
ncbi:MAG TPA: carboxypeptidase-like regulatory domain-containing protein [Prolixibacteraceae bacterium]|nr:carboxypeptidase-like regulatory domain-containing protein [Prolixibacteraceae bacterium]